MKRKALYTALGLEAAACIVLFGFGDAKPGLTAGLAAFPFEGIGLLLRKLSLSGSAGNICAIVLYGALCLLPLLVFLRRGLHKRSGEDVLLLVLSGLLFYVLYMMINPSLMWGVLALGDGSMGKALLSGMLWSVLLAYIVLRLLRFWRSADKTQLKGNLSPLLSLCAAVFVFAAFGGGLAELSNDMQALRQGNTALSPSQLLPSRVFIYLRSLVSALPLVLDVFIIFRALDLLRELEQEPYSEECVAAAKALAELSVKSLTATVLSLAGLNILQILFAHTLRSIEGSVSVPIISMVFAAAALLFARLMGDAKALQDENDLMI